MNMVSYGSQWKPCERTNGTIMMKVPTPPIVWSLDDCARNLAAWLVREGFTASDWIVLNSKKEVKDILQWCARLNAWNSNYMYEYHTPDDIMVTVAKDIIANHFPEFTQEEE
tara:strand:- start:195 stop:530 length:336 start_codon:yes stop_codon:yes gene_type:complete